jgi:hypothetical protein
MATTGVSVYQWASVDDPAEHQRINETKALLGAYSSPSGAVLTTGWLVATGDVQESALAGTVAGLGEGFVLLSASGYRALVEANAAASSSSAPSLTRINLANPSTPKQGMFNPRNNVLRGRMDSCGHVACSEVTGLTVRQLSEASPRIPVSGGTTGDDLIRVLDDVGVQAASVEGFRSTRFGPAITDTAEAEFLMRGYPDGTLFIYGWELPNQPGHWINVAKVDGQLIMWDRSMFSVGRWVRPPGNAANPEVIVIGEAARH